MRRAAAAVLAALALASCGSGGDDRAPDPGGSTLESTWVDPDGDGVLEVGPGERPVERTELAPASRTGREIARLGVVSDVHMVDEESPAHLPFLDRLGAPFNSTFRPHEPLQPRVLAATVKSLNAARPQAVLEAGDLVDSAQANELDQAVGILNGAREVRVDTGAPGYEGPQRASNPDPLIYRPDVDAPRRPGLLEAASRPVGSPGLRAPWYPVLGNHDVLVSGEIAPTRATSDLATGDRALTRIDPDFRLPEAGEAPFLAPETVDRILADGLPGRTERRSPDPGRRQLDAARVVDRLRGSSGAVQGGARLDHAFDVGAGLRVVVLDVVARDRGAEGRVTDATLAFLRSELTRPGSRRIAVAMHQPPRQVEGSDDVLRLLDRDPRVVALLTGHVHRNTIAPRRTAGGGYWLIETSALADHPQQARALALVRTDDGRHALSTWMLDPAPGDPQVANARRLAYLDVQGGRPSDASGSRRDRNALLFLPR